MDGQKVWWIFDCTAEVLATGLNQNLKNEGYSFAILLHCLWWHKVR